ncbi:hypothetical protein NB311A_03124 [Nitrobacter sp. Nb-311A]|nr:hypothetical protein NB311A_03124 [Nitrobacter sp. Nb-311A]
MQMLGWDSQSKQGSSVSAHLQLKNIGIDRIHDFGSLRSIIIVIS